MKKNFTNINKTSSFFIIFRQRLVFPKHAQYELVVRPKRSTTALHCFQTRVEIGFSVRDLSEIVVGIFFWYLTKIRIFCKKSATPGHLSAGRWPVP